MKRPKRVQRNRLKRGTRDVKLGLLRRTMTIERADHGEEDDSERGRVIEFSFSSELEYERYFGVEVLGHKRTEVNLDTLGDAGAFLKDHDTRHQIGVIEKAWLDTKERRGRVRARFGKTALAEEERVEVSEGIRTKVSVGYIVHEMKLDKTVEGLDFYRVTSWEPVEVSTVAIPADGSVGMGRESELPGVAARAALFADHRTRVIGTDPRKRGNRMHIKVVRISDGKLMSIRAEDFEDDLYVRVAEEAAPNPDPPPAPAPIKIGRSEADIAKEAAQEAAKAERERVQKISAIGAKFNSSDLASKAIGEGVSFDEFRMQLWEAGATPGGTAGAGTRAYPSIEGNPHDAGISQREAAEKYSLLRAIRSYAEGDATIAPYEREISDEIAGKAGVSAPRGFYVPRELLGAPIAIPGSEGSHEALRELLRAVSTTVGGGAAVSTDLLAQSFIEILRNESVALSLGATLLPGLVGDVDIPRQSAAGSAAWVGEGGSALDADLTLDLVSLRPKTLTAKSTITRRLMLQSTPAIEALVRADLAMAIALGIDLGAINGDGTGNNPTGILNMAGVGAGLSLGTNGGAQTWQNQVKLVELVRAANAHTGALGWATSAACWGHLMVTPKVGGQPNFILNEPGDSSIGRQFRVSEQVPSNLVKGGSGATLSGLVYGDWSQLLIGEWGSMDLFPDIYTSGDQGATILRVFQDADIQARHEDAFAVSKEISTV